MKNKIILLEDRPIRQEVFTNLLNKDSNSFPSLTNIGGGNDFLKFKENIFDDISVFDNYKTIMIHRSALSNDERAKLIDYIGNNEKLLVFFSGGISSTLFQQVGKGQLLTINSKDFYSENLLLFIENNGREALELAFGKNWKLSLLIDANEKLSFYILGYSNLKPLQIVRDELNLPNWISNIYFKSEENLIEKENLLKIRNKILSDIKKLLP